MAVKSMVDPARSLMQIHIFNEVKTARGADIMSPFQKVRDIIGY